MRASEKELKCIDISRELRKRVVQRKINELKQQDISLFIAPIAFTNFFVIDYKKVLKENSIFQSVLFILVMLVLYTIGLPMLLLVNIYMIITGKRNTLLKQFKKIRNTYYIDNEVSEIKSFSQLWDDKGLRDYGTEFWIYSGYTKAEQQECIDKWFEILYGNIEKVSNISKTISDKQVEESINFHRSNQGHINMGTPIVFLPEKIDEKFGFYVA